MMELLDARHPGLDDVVRMKRLLLYGKLSVWVGFMDELPELGECENRDFSAMDHDFQGIDFYASGF